MECKIETDAIPKTILLLNISLGIVANVFAFHLIKHDFVGGTFHHHHPHIDKDWWKWQPNTVLNNISIATAIDMFSCIFAVVTRMCERPDRLISKRFRAAWDMLNLFMAIVSVLMIGGAANLLLPLYLYNDYLGPCLANSSLSVLQHEYDDDHDDDHHSLSVGHPHRYLMHTPTTIVGGISESMTVPPYHIPVFQSGNLNAFTVIIALIASLKLYIVPNFRTVFRAFL